MDRGQLARMLGEGMSLAAIGRLLGGHESTVAYWVELHGLRAVNAERHAPRGRLERKALEALVAEGLSIAQIAARVDRSKPTVRRWLRTYELKTQPQRGGGGVAREARLAGLPRVEMTCATHGLTEFVLEGRGYHRCVRCRAQRVSERRRRIKETLVAEAGANASYVDTRDALPHCSFITSIL